MTFDDDIEADIKKDEKRRITRDPFESAKQKLRDKQENEYEDPDNIYVNIKIPVKGKIGENCVIKFSKKVPFAQVVISADVQWKKIDKYDKASKPEIVCRGFIINEYKDVKEVKIPWEDMGTLQQKPTNLLRAGEYMVEARGYSTEAYEETTARRLVQVE